MDTIIKDIGKVVSSEVKIDKDGKKHYYLDLEISDLFAQKVLTDVKQNDKVLKLIKADPNYTKEDFHKLQQKYYRQIKFIRKLIQSNEKIHFPDESTELVKRFHNYIKNTQLEKEVKKLPYGKMHLDKTLRFMNKQFEITIITTSVVPNFMSVYVKDTLTGYSMNDDYLCKDGGIVQNAVYNYKTYDCMYLFYLIERELRQEAINSWFRDERRRKELFTSKTIPFSRVNLNKWWYFDHDEEYEDNFNSVIKQMSEIEMAEKLKERKSIFSLFDNVDAWDIKQYNRPTYNRTT